MSCVFFAITVTDRTKLSAFMEIYRENGIGVHYVTMGRGTAHSELLDTLGLDSSERAVCFSVVTPETWESTKKALQRRLKIDVPGTGIVFTMPMSSVGGKRELSFLLQEQHFEKGDEETLKDTEHELIVAICEQGYSDSVMDAAKAAGAGGGTVIHAKGTGMTTAVKFMGITLAAEKDIIFIVTQTARKNAIMSAIMEKAGRNSHAKGMAFSLPVTDTAGLRLIDED